MLDHVSNWFLWYLVLIKYVMSIILSTSSNSYHWQYLSFRVCCVVFMLLGRNFHNTPPGLLKGTLISDVYVVKRSTDYLSLFLLCLSDRRRHRVQ